MHDSLLLQDALEAVVVKPPNPLRHEQHLCLDKALSGAPPNVTARVFGYEPHVRPVGDGAAALEARRKGERERHKPRRRVVERTISWLNRCRGILVHYEKKAGNYPASVQLTCAR